MFGRLGVLSGYVSIYDGFIGLQPHCKSRSICTSLCHCLKQPYNKQPYVEEKIPFLFKLLRVDFLLFAANKFYVVRSQVYFSVFRLTRT